MSFVFKERTLFSDTETFSSVNLKKCGLYRYFNSDDAAIILLAYAFDNEPVKCIDILSGEKVPQEFIDALTDPKVIKRAFNAAFERQAYLKHFGIYCDPESFRCTMVLGWTLGLPGSLGQQAAVLKMPLQKMSDIGKDGIKTFCCPIKPTKKNGYKTRNYPKDFPEKWEGFKKYNVRDVEAERGLYCRLAKYDQACTWPAWAMDQRMNDRGILADMQLVDNAIAMNDTVKAKLTQQAVALTGLSNPNSVTQLVKWLNNAEEEEDKLRVRFADDEDSEAKIKNLRKKTVIDLLGSDLTPAARRMLELRQLMAKSSVSKYHAIKRAVCSDGRVRGLYQFYGAARTGRWAGRIVQFQNLPQNKLKDLELCRRLVRAGDLATLEVLFGESVLIVLSELIRTAFVPAPGHRFISVDYKAIEARLAAWDAQEEWRLEVFRTHGLIYEASASEMFKVPMKLIEKGGPRAWDLRPKGKITELACLGPATQVLTSRGYLAITAVRLTDKLWDGTQWITHKGLVSRGIKRVQDLDGLKVTPDHLVLTKQTWTPAKQLGLSESTLCQALARGSENLPSSASTLGQGAESTQPWCSALVALRPTKLGSITCAAGRPRDAMSAQRLGRARLAASTFGNMPTSCLTQSIGGDFSTGSPLHLVPATGRRTKPTLTTVAGESGSVTSGERTSALSCAMSSLALGGIIRGLRWIASRPIMGMNQGIFASLRREKTTETSAKSKFCKPELTNWSDVYDIAHAGPLNRFTIRTNSGHLIVHNCGYQGGPNALVNMGALEGDSGIKEEDLLPMVRAWRAASPAIVKGWYQTQDDAEAAIRRKTSNERERYGFDFKAGTLFQVLPTGRKLAYPHARFEQNEKYDKIDIVFDGVNQYTHQWGTVKTFGGKLFQNRIQAHGVELLIEGMFRVERILPRIVGSVHDEIIVEVPLTWMPERHSEKDLRSKGAVFIENLICEPHKSYPGLPLAADAEDLTFYRK